MLFRSGRRRAFIGAGSESGRGGEEQEEEEEEEKGWLLHGEHGGGVLRTSAYVGEWREGVVRVTNPSRRPRFK